MRTLLTLLALLCAGTDALLFAEWLSRGDYVLATCAGGMTALAGAAAVLFQRLRF